MLATLPLRDRDAREEVEDVSIGPFNASALETIIRLLYLVERPDRGQRRARPFEALFEKCVILRETPATNAANSPKSDERPAVQRMAMTNRVVASSCEARPSRANMWEVPRLRQRRVVDRHHRMG